MADQIFYLAEAHVWAVEGPHTYTLWLLDHSNSKRVDDWRKGAYTPKTELVSGFRLDRTVDSAGVGADHVDKHSGVQIGNLIDDPIGMQRRGRIAIAEALWNKIPESERPLPTDRKQTYRLRLVVSGARAYLGFHTQVLALDSGELRCLFYSWQDKVLGDTWVDPAAWTNGTIHPGESSLRSNAKVGDVGSMFVALDSWGMFNNVLAIPKVPWGTQE